MATYYKVQRIYRDKPGTKRTILHRLPLTEAQAYCGDPESSSSTCTTAAAKRITRRNGPWFHCYTQDK